MIEKFSSDCRRTKTKVVATLAIAKHIENLMNQSQLKANECSRHEARENSSERFTIDLGFTSDWTTKWREVLKPIVWRSYAKPKKGWMTFDTQVKTTPWSYHEHHVLWQNSVGKKINIYSFTSVSDSQRSASTGQTCEYAREIAKKKKKFVKVR